MFLFSFCAGTTSPICSNGSYHDNGGSARVVVRRKLTTSQQTVLESMKVSTAPTVNILATLFCSFIFDSYTFCMAVHERDEIK